MNSQKDVAGEAYWSEEWRSDFDIAPEDERNRGWRNHATLQLDELFQRFVGPLAAQGRPLAVTEIGCARSRWLPYFARRFGASVSGLDYSDIGCEQARIVLERSGVTGRIVNGDLFNPPPDMVGAADVVYSWGLVEHFADTSGVVGALERFVRPGGLLITIIPNMTGAVGAVQKWINEKVYLLHVPIDRERLADSVKGRAGELLFCDYFLASNFWTVNPGKGTEAQHGLIKRLVFRTLILSTVAIWLIERVLRIRLPATRAMSPYVISIWRVGVAAPLAIPE